MSLENLYYIFNIFAPIITTIGIILSFWVSLKTLNEVKYEKILAQKPYLLFEQGGVCDKALFVKAGRTSPGFNPELMKIIKNSIPKDAIQVQREFLEDGQPRLFGHLKNYGNGAAFNIELTWIPKIVWLNNEKFVIDDTKNREAKYSRDFNTKPVGEFNLLPQQTTGILHWPMFIEMDYNLCITRVEGYFQLSYDNSFGNHYRTYQGYHLFTDYQAETPSVHVTFLETFSNETDWDFEE